MIPDWRIEVKRFQRNAVGELAREAKAAERAAAREAKRAIAKAVRDRVKAERAKQRAVVKAAQLTERERFAAKYERDREKDRATLRELVVAVQRIETRLTNVKINLGTARAIARK